MRSDRAPLALALAAAGVGTVSATILPYNPTTIFLSPNDSSVAYIIDDQAGNLLTLNISSTIKAGDIDAITANKLPFSESDTSISYTPSISPSGSIGIYAGSCDSNSSLWTYPYSTSNEGATWSEIPTSDSSSLSTLGGGHGPGYLASSFYFSTNVETDDTNRSIYTFGGMCPTGSAADEETLQAGANYTNRMLKLSPLARKWPLAYEASLSAVTGLKPVPEAGFTMTALQSTYSNSSSGHVTQAQTYVVIGGHTEGAFIGMNQVALFSLPQESWTFQSVSTGPSEPNSELATIERRRRKYATVPVSSDGRVAKRQSNGVPESRSGHTAVLSSDGSRIIVFGGWVGDVNTPAEPLLAVLHLGSGFGGVGAWSWELPEMNGTEFGLGKKDGIYGHGAIMLPGDMLMFAGGNKIAPTESKTKRADPGLQAMFLDTTSMTWTDGYTNPDYDPSNPSAPGQSGSGGPAGSGDTSKKVAIGTGVGVAIFAIFGAVALFFWYRRKLNRKHVAARDRDLAALSQTTHRNMAFYGEQAEMQQRIGADSLGSRTLSQGWGFGGESAIDAYTGAAYGPIEYQGYDHGHVEEGGVSYVQPQQPGGFQIPRKPANIRNARGVYQPAPLSQNNHYSNFELGAPHSRANSLGTAGAIHPIYEADEDDHGDMANTNLIDAQRLHDLPGPSPVESNSDPFQDPESQRGSRMMPILELPPRSPSRGRNGTSPERYDLTKEEREREIKEWVSDWAAADTYAMGHTASTSGPHGTRNTQSHSRLSPSKDTNSYSGRTDSNLSDQSAVTLSRNNSAGTRTKSLTAFFTGGGGWGMFGSGNMPQGGGVSRQLTIINNEYLGPASGRVTAEPYYPSGSTSPEGDSRNSTLTASGPAGTLQPPKSSGNGSNKSGSSGNSVSHHSNGSYITAQSHISAGFIGLKEQAENLLPRPGAWEPGSPSKSKGLKRRSPGWLGSIKKALGREEWVGSSGTEPEDRENLRYDGVGYGGYADSPSPTRTGFDDHPYADRAYNDESFPTRTASASASLWRRKQGRGDWEDSPDERAFAGGVQRNLTVAVPPGAGKEDRAEDEDWDVEKAVQGRQVQVMFTVPKERLRVVNHDVSDDESDIGMVRDLLSGSPIRGGTPTLERQLSRLSGRSQIRPESSASRRMPVENLEMLNMGESMDKGNGKKPEHDVPLPLRPVRHLPPPPDAPLDVPKTRPQSPLRLDTSQELPPRTTASPKPPSPLKHLPPPREDTKSPALSVKLKHVDDPISRSGSPAKSLRSVRSGKVADMVKQMEEIAKSPEI